MSFCIASVSAFFNSIPLCPAKSANGEVVSTPVGIAGHIARTNPGAKLFGNGVFQEGKVNEWIAWAECLSTLANKISNDILTSPKDLDQKVHTEDVNRLKKEVSHLNTHLKGKKWIVGDATTLADIICGLTLLTSFQLVLDAGFRKGRPDLAKWFESFAALP